MFFSYVYDSMVYREGETETETEIETEKTETETEETQAKIQYASEESQF